jgi:hypothetical protein
MRSSGRFRVLRRRLRVSRRRRPSSFLFVRSATGVAFFLVHGLSFCYCFQNSVPFNTKFTTQNAEVYILTDLRTRVAGHAAAVPEF